MDPKRFAGDKDAILWVVWVELGWTVAPISENRLGVFEKDSSGAWRFTGSPETMMAIHREMFLRGWVNPDGSFNRAGKLKIHNLLTAYARRVL